MRYSVSDGQFDYWVQRTGMSEDQLDRVLTTFVSAADGWARYVDGIYSIIYTVVFEDLPGSALAEAGPRSDIISQLNRPSDSVVDGYVGIDLPRLLDGTFFFPGEISPFDDVPLGQYDLHSVLVHELGHIFGFNAGSMTPFVSNGVFTGAAATAEWGTAVPIAAGDPAHLGVADIMFPSISSGVRKSVSALDIAILRDLGFPVKDPSNGNDTIWGFEGRDDTLNGLAGDDVFHGLSGDDIIQGGEGYDRAYYQSSIADYNIELNGDGSITITDTNLSDGYDEGSDTLYGVERAYFADTSINAAPSEETVPSVAMEDRIVLTESDVRNEFNFFAFLFGDNGYGEDRAGTQVSSGLQITLSFPILLEITHVNGMAINSSTATVSAEGISASVSTNGLMYGTMAAAENMAAGETATLVFSYTLAGNAPGINDGTVTVEIIGQDDETLFLRNGDDVVATGDGDDFISGADGDDIIDGGSGRDEMDGGKGNDTFAVDHIEDRVIEEQNAGSDVVYTSVSYDVPLNVEVLIMTGTDNINSSGTEARDQIFGNSSDNIIDGGAGFDVMVGGAGNDTYAVDNSLDAVIEEASGGFDNVYSSVDYILDSSQEIESAILTGTATVLRGDDSANQLFGNDEINVIDGRGGTDFMLGGGGADIFQINLEPGAVDVVGDFSKAEGDRMAFTGFNAATTFVNQASATSFEVRDTKGTADLTDDTVQTFQLWDSYDPANPQYTQGALVFGVDYYFG